MRKWKLGRVEAHTAIASLCAWWTLGLACFAAVPQAALAEDPAIATAPVSRYPTLDHCMRNPLCGDVLAVGHRGTLLEAPENSLPAFEAAIAMGADAVEMDVRSTRDGVLILLHDANLDRTTDCEGRLADKTWDEIKDCRMTSVLSEVTGGPLARLYPTLRALKGRTLIDLDVKTPLAQKLVFQVKLLGMANQVMVLARNMEQASYYNRAGIAVLARAESEEQVVGLLGLEPKPVAVAVSPMLLPRVQQLVHAVGSRTFVDALGICDLFGERCYKRLVTWGADLIQTDRLPTLVPFLAESAD